MRRIFSKTFCEVAVLILLGFTPLLWFQKDQIILGHDAGLTLNPIAHFFDRLYLWTPRFGFGHDQSYALPGFFIHGLEALVSYFFPSIQSMQKIVFIFWFVLPGLTMYYLARRLEQKMEFRYVALLASVFYMFNHFVLQGWFVAERTKFSLYAALPLLIAFLFDWEDKRKSTLISAIVISITFLFLNGEGSLPLFGGIILALLVFIVYYLLKNRSIKAFLALLYLFILTGIFSILLQAYWLLPFIAYVRSSYTTVVQQAGGLAGILGWVSYISKDASLINLFRLQGIPEWYENPLHAYANEYLNNPILIFVSFLLPLLAFSSLILIKRNVEKKYIIFFSFLAIVGIIFAAGSHPPFGTFYTFLVKFVPGFIAFRTPFYKFAPAIWFSYALLISFTISILLQKYIVPRNRVIALAMYLVICGGVILYSYPFLTGSFFNYMVGKRTMQVSIPSYIYDYGNWSSTPERKHKRTLMLPPTNQFVESYSWRYWSLSPITSLLTDASSVNQYGMSQNEANMMTTVFSLMKHNDPNWLQAAKMFGIQSFTIRNDFLWDNPDSQTDNPQVYEDVLRNTPGVMLVKEFGPWKTYDIVNVSSLNLSASNYLNYVVADVSDLPTIATLPKFSGNSVTYREGDVAENTSDILNRANAIFISPQCVLCSLRPPIVDEGTYVPTLTADSFLYPLTTLKREKKEKLLTTAQEKVEYYTTQSLVDQKGLERVIDEKKPKDSLEKTMHEYENTLKKLNESLQLLVKENNIDNNSLLTKTFSYLSVQKTNYIDKVTLASTIVDVTYFNNVFALLDSTLLLVKNNLWFTSDITNKKYTFSIPETKNYQLHVKQNSLSTPEIASSRTLQFSIDNKNFDLTPQAIEKGWIEIADLPLTKGVHKMSFNDSPLKNIYSSWNTSARITEDLTKTQTCFESRNISSEAAEIYSMSLEYRQLQGNGSFFFYPLQQNDIFPPLTKQGIELKNRQSTEKLQTYYSPTNNKGFYFLICTRINTEKNQIPSIMQIDNITVSKVTNPQFVFSSVTSAPPVTTSSVKIENPTKYSLESLETMNDAVVLFDNSYNNNWQISPKENNKFMANGFANGWMITNPDKTIKVSYATQYIVFISSIISTITFIGLIFYLIYSHIHYEKKIKH